MFILKVFEKFVYGVICREIIYINSFIKIVPNIENKQSVLVFSLYNNRVLNTNFAVPLAQEDLCIRVDNLRI